jgi:hypothetical protein
MLQFFLDLAHEVHTEACMPFFHFWFVLDFNLPLIFHQD